ncbi:MAG: SDR family oxidoreductase [Candidatus Eisenbacteria bacterium]|nr:SDR family oxidoreductase [Candidatus Eisenbacteria bacterium]
MRSFDLTDRVVILTGAAGLIGRHYLPALADAGAIVVAADRDRAGAEAAIAELDARRALAVEVDLTRRESVREMVLDVARRFDRIDGLVNNAAIDPKFDAEHQGEHGLDFESLPLDQWQASLDVNLSGAFLCAQAVAPLMQRQQSGSVVNISSIYGLVGPDQRLYEREDGPRQVKPVTYTVTKAGLIGLTRYLATYWRGTGIRANTLTLGGVFNAHDDEFVRRYSARTLLGRMAQADEYNGALIFLLSEASAYMTGANLVVDGGWTAW